MDNSNLDLYTLFHDDPELLSILGNAKKGQETERPAVLPASPARQDQEIDARERYSDAPILGEGEQTTAPRAEEEQDWTSLLRELDQLLADASDPPKPELPPGPSSPAGYSDAYPGGEEDDPLVLHPPFIASPLDGKPEQEDPEGSFSFEKATPFDSDKPSDLSAAGDEQGSSFPYSDQAAAEFLDGKADLMQQEKLDAQQEESSPSRGKRVVSVVFNVAFVLLCVLLVAGSAIFAFSSDQDKSFLGLRFFNVLSQSMTPQADSPPGGFRKGDIIVIKTVSDPNEISKGDVVTIRPGDDEDTFLTHRVVDITTQADGESGLFFTLRGDANNTDDPPVSSERLVGKLILTLPGAGDFLAFVRENLILVVVFLLALVVFGVLLRSLLLSRNKAAKRNDSEPPPEVFDGR